MFYALILIGIGYMIGHFEDGIKTKISKLSGQFNAWLKQ